MECRINRFNELDIVAIWRDFFLPAYDECDQQQGRFKVKYYGANICGSRLEEVGMDHRDRYGKELGRVENMQEHRDKGGGFWDKGWMTDVQ